MLLTKVLIAVCVIAQFCAALSINIQGNVKNRTGTAISGATVKLEIANISATTGPDGSFALTGTLGIRPKNNLYSPVQSSITLQHGQIQIFLEKKALVAINIRNVSGRLIIKSENIYDAGTHIIPSPSNVTGINLYRVSIGRNTYIFKSSPIGSFSGDIQFLSGNSFRKSLSKQAKASAVFRDVITVMAEGYINYRDSVKTSDTTGMVVAMIPNAGNVTDVDGNVYQSVQIGNQVWTTENLKTTKYNDGTTIPYVTDNAEWESLKTGAFCYYNNDTTNKDKYGALYHWFAVRTGKLAPAGWHVPTDAEWDTLLIYLTANGYNWDKTTKGNKVGKSLSAKTDWAYNATIGTIGNDPSTNNTTGFSALPGGRRTYASEKDRFIAKDSIVYWWTFTEEPDVPSTKAWNYVMSHNSARLKLSVHYKEYGLSVRLVKDK